MVRGQFCRDSMAIRSTPALCIGPATTPMQLLMAACACAWVMPAAIPFLAATSGAKAETSEQAHASRGRRWRGRCGRG